MQDDNPHLRTIGRVLATDMPPDDDTGLPPLDDAGRAYTPHARPANKPLYAIHFVTPTGDVRSFQYVHLDSDSTYTAGSVTLRFLGMEPMKVVLRGRNLWRLYDYIHQHRIAWVMQAARDFAADGQTLVTQISMAKIEPEA